MHQNDKNDIQTKYQFKQIHKIKTTQSDNFKTKTTTHLFMAFLLACHGNLFTTALHQLEKIVVMITITIMIMMMMIQYY